VTVRSSLDRQMTTRIDAEIELLRQEFTSEGNMALVAEVKERSNLIQALAYLVTDAHGNRLAGNLPSMPAGDGWINVNTNGARANDPPRQFRIRSITLDHGMRLAVGDDLAPTDDIRTAFLEALGWSLLAFAVLSLSGGALLSLGFLRR